MPKRKREETKEERWSRKLKKYEVKLQETRRRNNQRIIYSSDEEDVQPEEHLESGDADLANRNIIPCEAFDDNPAAPPIDEEQLLGSNEAPVEALDVYDVEILQALGDVEPEAVEFADELHADVASRFQQILVNGLKKESKEELLKKYIFPRNVPFSKAPTLNPEIEVMLAEICRLRDKRLVNKQDQLGRALSAIGKAMTGLLKKNPDIPEVARTLNDAGKLIADSHYMETDTRRSVIIPLVDKSFTDPFKNQKRDNFLFGESLGDVVKNSRGIKKTSQLIQATASSSKSSLNYKGPSTRSQQQWVGQTYPQHRVGGQRATYSNRRRLAGPPPPAPARRRPAPPPPQPRRQPAQRHRVSTERPRK